MNKTQILIAAVIISIIGMSSAYLDFFKMVTSDPNEELESKVKHGEIRQYTKDERLKTIVNYDQGIKHGLSYLYHDDGETVLLAMPYDKGKREGTSKKYYANGNLYAATPYKNDKLHGIRKIYYSSGRLKAEVPYGYGLPGIGTKEYLIDGTEKSSIQITMSTSNNLISLSTSESCKDPKFYIGRLIDDQFFDPVDQNIKLLMEDDGNFFINTEVHTPSYLKYQDIICHCESSQGNPVVLKTRIIL